MVRLIDRAPGYAPSDRAELIDWLRDWANNIEADGNAVSLCLVIETEDGGVYKVCQSLRPMDRTRMVGLLTTVTHRLLDGEASVP